MNKSASFSAATPWLNRAQLVDLLVNVGNEVTTLIEGYMGDGKTSLLKDVCARTGLRGVYFDCTTKDLGDLFLPRIKDTEGGDCVSFVPNEEFGIHFNEPIVLMLDEFGKNRSIQNGLLRVMQERCIGSRPLPPGSIVFATTNLSAENIGDTMQPHARNRIMIVRKKKTTGEEWMQWGTGAGIAPELLTAAHELPDMFEGFLDVPDAKANTYIHHPGDPARTAFVTCRSLEKASHVVKQRAVLGDEIVLNAMMGLIGAKAANDIMTLVNLGDTLPKYEQIASGPTSVKVPDSAAGCIMSALMCLQRVQQPEFANVFTYIKRLPAEMTALFAVQATTMPGKGGWVSGQSSFTDYVRKNAHLFGSK